LYDKSLGIDVGMLASIKKTHMKAKMLLSIHYMGLQTLVFTAVLTALSPAVTAAESF
jgi:ABC-type antimicrobial peptide transport system permease subunit